MLLEGHSLSQQGVWASFGHPNPQKSPLRTPNFFVSKFLKYQIQAYNWISKLPILAIHFLNPGYDPEAGF